MDKIDQSMELLLDQERPHGKKKSYRPSYQKVYKSKYERYISVCLSRNDEDLKSWLDSLDVPLSSYIKKLIREDMRRNLSKEKE